MFFATLPSGVGLGLVVEIELSLSLRFSGAHFGQLLLPCLILQSRESSLDKFRVLFIIGGIVVVEICRDFPRVSGTPKQPS